MTQQVLRWGKINHYAYATDVTRNAYGVALPHKVSFQVERKKLYMEIKEQGRTFVTSNFYVADPATLEDEVSLLDRGIIDSTGVLEVIFFIEDTFGITVEDSEMLPDNLDSIERIANFIARKKG
jgi:acyl carrier protein